MHSSIYSRFLLCLLLIAGHSYPGAAITSGFSHYDISNGLTDNAVLSVLQDERGFVWMGTTNGLNRFDGHAFKTFRSVPGDSTSIGSNYIYSLFKDVSQDLWVGTRAGIYIFEPREEVFHRFDAATADGVEVNSLVSAIAADPDGRVWIATSGQGVFSWWKGELIQYINTAEEDRRFLSTVNNYFLYVDRQGTVWVAAQDLGTPLSRYDAGKDSFERYPLQAPANVLDGLSIYTLTEDEAGYLWLGSWAHGLCRLDKKTGETRFYLSPDQSQGALHVHSLLLYDSSTLLVGSDNGLHQLDMETGRSELITFSANQADKLSDRFIYPIFRDREGGLWIGTYFGGVNYLPPAKGDLKGFQYAEKSNSVSGNIISRFCEDQQGNIWIGSDDGGLSFLDVASGQFTNYLPAPGRNSLSYHNIHALYMEPEDNKLWIGTYSGGLNVLDLDTKRFKLYGYESGLNNSSVYALYKDSKRELWVGTMSSILTYNPDTDNFTRLRNTETTTLDIIEDPEGHLWFATGGKGLLRYDALTERWDQYTYSLQDPSSIPSNQVNCLCLDHQADLWIGTENGLALWDAENEEFRPVVLPVPSNSICDIVSYKEELWLTTTNGLICYDPARETVRTLFKSDGLLSDQFVTKAALLSSAGELYLGTINGFNVLKPDLISENTYIPPVYITNLQIFNRDERISREGILNSSIEYMDSIELSYKQNVFSIEYAALSYSSPDRNQYRYRMTGFDRDWNVVGNQRKATYTNLPPGEYDFQVIASNNDGRWNETGKTLRVIIHPPFWRTGIAYFFYILITFATLGYIIWFIRRKAERRQNYRIREIEREKEKELQEAKITFFTQIAHEIRTPVSLIIGPMEKMKGKSEQIPSVIQEDLDVIDRNGQRLLTLINQLLDFRKIEEGSNRIVFSKVNIHELLDNIRKRFKPLMEQKGLNFQMETGDNPLMADVDPEAFTKMVSNLLTNAAKHAKSQIAVSAIGENEQLILKVTDDGEGIPQQEYTNIFKPFYQVINNKKEGSGIGLSLVKQLVKAHNGVIEVDSLVHIYTTFIIRMPISQSVETETEPTPSFTGIKGPELLPDDLSAEDLTGSENRAYNPALLIVEDNEEMLEFLVRIFRDNYTVFTAGNGREGLRVLKKRSVEIIISDVMMPVMDGISFSKKVKGTMLHSHIPLILLTARTDKDSKIAGIKAGADAYVEKPFSPQILQAQVENLLASRRALSKAFSEKPLFPMDSIAGNKADEKFLNTINMLVEKNISNPEFSIEYLADAMGISRSTFFVKVKTLLDMTPNELIHLMRLRKAAELLSSKNYRVNEVCYEVGFNSPSYFAKCFQKQFGVSPKDFASRGS